MIDARFWFNGVDVADKDHRKVLRRAEKGECRIKRVDVFAQMIKDHEAPIIFTITGSLFIGFLFLLSLSRSSLRQVYRSGKAAPAYTA